MIVICVKIQKTKSSCLLLNLVSTFHKSFAHGVIDLNETQKKGGIHSLCLPEQLILCNNFANTFHTSWDKTHISGRFQTLHHPPSLCAKISLLFLKKWAYLREEKSDLKAVENLNTCDHPKHHSKKKEYLHTSGTSSFFRFWSIDGKISCKFWGGGEWIFE